MGANSFPPENLLENQPLACSPRSITFDDSDRPPKKRKSFGRDVD